MQTFTKPKVYLIARPVINWDGVEWFFQAEYGKTDCWTDGGVLAGESTSTDAELIPEFAGRMCYCSFDKKQGRKTNMDYINNIIDMGHGSVLEHVNFTFLITQCSRGFTHEMVRHRAGFAYSQESTHYIDYSDTENVKVYIPPYIENQGMRNAYLAQYNAVVDEYGALFRDLKLTGLQKKDICSTVRPLLPIGIESKLCLTGNVRALRHFIENRGNVHNVLEIRLVAFEVYSILVQECPNLLHGIQFHEGPDGYPEVEVRNRKV